MNKLIWVSLLVVLGVGGLVTPARADVLLIQQVHKEHQRSMPRRGMSMAQVRRIYGTPSNRLDTRGGDAPKHPPINRWVYPDYIVYFERNHVIHAVINPPGPPKH